MGSYLQFLSLQMTQSFAGQWVMIRKWTYCGKTYEECSDGHRTGKCCLIRKSALLCTWERETKSYRTYVMGGKVLKVSEEERDLGVIMHRSAKPSRQCDESSKKANSTLGMIRRTIVTRDKDTILRLYKTLVRPQLEYCIQVWSPYLKQDMEKLEKVQRRATKMIQGYKYLS